MIKGTVEFFNDLKRFGFITGKDGKKYFVHQTGLNEGVTICDNDSVSFDVEKGDKGPKAVNVRLVSSEESDVVEIEKSETEGCIIKILDINDETAEEFDKSAEKCAKDISGVSYSKLRDFYAYVKDIKEFDKVKLYLLKPKLAYAVGKADSKSKSSLEKFQKMMILLIDNCDNEKKFKHLKEFFEAIVSYHKIYGKVD